MNDGRIISINDINTMILTIGVICTGLSICFHTMSCLCKVGDIACAKSCHNRFVFANVIGIIGLTFLIGLGITMVIENKFKRKW